MSTLRTPETGFRSSWLQFFRGVSPAQRRLPVSPSQSGSPFVPQLVAAWAAEKRRAPAVTGPAESLSYVELEAQSNALARYLCSLGAGPEVPIALFLERSPALLLSALAVMKAGAAFLPLDPSYPAERINLIFNDARVPIVLTTSTRKAELPPGPWTVVDLTNVDSLLRTYSAATLPCEVQASQLAYVIYTSGSTGRPKGVEITHGNLLNLVQWHQGTFGVSGADRATLIASPGFDASVWESWPYLAAGASLHVPGDTTRVSPRALRDWMLANGITISFVPTPLAERLLTLEWPADAPLRFLLTGGDVLQQYPPAGLPFALVNNYGPTECTVVATSGIVSASDRRSMLPPIGKPITNTRAYILDEHLQQVPEGTAGALHISGANVGRGYVGDAKLTAEKFIPNPFDNEPGSRLYKTGDLARLLPDGQLEFLGRTDEQIKIRGYRIEPNEISVALCKHDAIQSAVVAARKDASGEILLVSYVVLKAGRDANAGELRKHLQARVPDYMIPSAFVRLDSLSLTSNGKVDRTALPAPDASNTLANSSAARSHTETQEKLAAILSKLLGVHSVNANDNFFLLGGHSLLGAQLLAQIQETFKVELPLRAIFDHPTIAAISAEIERTLKGPERAQ
jgi:amino acid adenylation domain-containing protein